MTNQSDPFDHLLANALRARPEHLPQKNIAAEAIARARLHHQHTALARISFWTRFCSAAAILLVVTTIAVACYEWPTATTSSTSEATTSTDTSTTTSSLDMTTIGAATFLAAILAITALTILTPERPTWRLTPT